MSSSESSLADRLTLSAEHVARGLNPIESNLVRRYQATDRTYELVSGVLRGTLTYDDLDEDDADAIARIVTALDDLTTRWDTPEPLTVYRGQRSIERTFDESPRPGREFELDSFVSTSIHRHVALEEFTEPPGPGGPVLLKISAPAGTTGLWVPPVGDPTLAYQGELILPRLTRLRISAVDTTADILTVNCEVLP